MDEQAGIARQALNSIYKTSSANSLYDVLFSLEETEFINAMDTPRCDNKHRLRRLRVRRARLRDFAKSTVVVYPGSARALAAAFTDYSTSIVSRRLSRLAPTQPELVKLLVEALVERHAYLPSQLCATHVLASGFKPDTDGGVGATYTAYHLNTTVTYVATNKTWLALREAIRPSTMYFLLAHCSVFCATDNPQTLLQVSGPSFDTVVTKEQEPKVLKKKQEHFDKERNLAAANSARIIFKKSRIMHKMPYMSNKNPSLDSILILF